MSVGVGVLLGVDVGGMRVAVFVGAGVSVGGSEVNVAVGVEDGEGCEVELGLGVLEGASVAPRTGVEPGDASPEGSSEG